MSTGVLPSQEDFARVWVRQARFAPGMSGEKQEARYAGWKQAVAATLSL